MKFILESLETVPESMRGEYEEKDGKFYLKLEGDYLPLVEATKKLTETSQKLNDSMTKITEFRDKNISLLKENDELRPLKTKFEGLDPDAAREALAKVAALGKKGIKDETDIDAKVKSTVDELLKPLRDQVAASVAETAAERKRADDFLFRSQIGEVFTKVGGKAKAIDFVVDQAQRVFEVKDRAIVAKTGNFSTERPGESLDITEWMSNIIKEHDYIIEPSKGGGAPSQKGSGGAPNLRPGQTLLKNPTPQQLGQYSKDIAAGKIKVEYETVQ